MNKQEAEIFFKKIYDGTDEDKYSADWWKHSHNVALVAETLGKKLNLDSEKCYVMGLLHDISKGNVGNNIRHSVVGYKIMKENNIDEEIAKQVVQKPISYLTKEHLDEITNMENIIKNQIINITFFL